MRRHGTPRFLQAVLCSGRIRKREREMALPSCCLSELHVGGMWGALQELSDRGPCSSFYGGHAPQSLGLGAMGPGTRKTPETLRL